MSPLTMSRPAATRTASAGAALLALLALLLTAPARAQGTNLSYGDYDPSLKFDWYVPSAPGPHPVLVFIHGGLAGKEAGAPAPGNMPQLLLANGFTVMSIDYRKFWQNPHPAQLQDAATAVQYFRENAAAFDIDPNRLAILGVSYGAALGGWLAYGADLAQPGGTSQEQQSTRPQALLNESGLTNFLLMVPTLGWNFPGATTIGQLPTPFLKSVSFAEMVADVPRDFTPPVASFYGEKQSTPPLTDPHDITLELDLHAKLAASYPAVAAQSQLLHQAPGVMDNYYEQRAAWLLLRFGIGHQLDLGKALAVHGQPAPRLEATGSWLPGGRVELSYQAPAAGVATVWLIVGQHWVQAPLKGGTLVPAPELMLPLQTAPDGSITLTAELPARVPMGTDFYLQCWQVEGAAPKGFVASNAVVGILVE